MRKFKKIRLNFSLMRNPSRAADTNDVKPVNWKGIIVLNNQLGIQTILFVFFPILRNVACVNRSLRIYNH